MKELALRNIVPIQYFGFLVFRTGFIAIDFSLRQIATYSCCYLEGSLFTDVVGGRMDFDNSVQQLMLRAGSSSDDYTVSIPITRDSYNEANEGFMIVMSPDVDRSNADDVANINFQNNGVALGVIDDDDREFYL